MVSHSRSRPSGSLRPVRQRRPAVVVAAIAVGAVALVGCGSDDEGSSAASPAATATPNADTTKGPSGTGLSAGAAGESSPGTTPTTTATDVPATPAETTTQAPAPTSATPQPVVTGWTPPPGTVPGRCGGNGMDGRQFLNGWEVCWTEGTISPEFAVNVAQAVAANGFADGTYQANSPTAGPKTINCYRFIAPNTGTTIFACNGGTVTGNGAVELAWQG